MKIEEKLSFFRDSIIDDVDSELAEKRKELAKETSEKLYLYQKKAKAKYEVMIETENQSTVETKRQMYSRAQIKKTEEILKHKNAIMNEIIQDIRRKLSDFVGTDAYYEYMNQHIDEAIAELGGVTKLELSFLKERFDDDKKAFYKKFSDLNTDIELTSFTRDKIGGLIVIDKDHDILYDLSLKALLESSIDEIGMIIYEEFDK